MSVTVPSSDATNYTKYQEVVVIKATVASTSSQPHQVAAQQRLNAAQVELVDSLMASGKVSSAGFLAAAVYGA